MSVMTPLCCGVVRDIMSIIWVYRGCYRANVQKKIRPVPPSNGQFCEFAQEKTRMWLKCSINSVHCFLGASFLYLDTLAVSTRYTYQPFSNSLQDSVEFLFSIHDLHHNCSWSLISDIFLLQPHGWQDIFVWWTVSNLTVCYTCYTCPCIHCISWHTCLTIYYGQWVYRDTKAFRIEPYVLQHANDAFKELI